MAAKLKGRKASDLIFTILLSTIIGIASTVTYVCNLITKGPHNWLYVKKRRERPGILCNEEYGVHQWIPLKRSRLKLHYVVAGPKSKPLLVFLHGFPEFWYSWRHQLKEFSKDYRVVAVDMRGYSDSDKPRRVSDYTIDKLVEDVDELIESLGYDKAIVVGHDWGGIVAWSYAILHEERVSKLIVCNIPHPLAFEKHLNTSFSQLMKSWYIFLFQIPCLPILKLRASDFNWLEGVFTSKGIGAKPGTFTSEEIELYKYTFAEYGDLLGPINYYRALMRYGRPELPKTRLKVPTLLIWGTHDGALERKMADMSANYVEHFTLKYIEGASHWVQQEEPGKVNAFMREFIEDQTEF